MCIYYTYIWGLGQNWPTPNGWEKSEGEEEEEELLYFYKILNLLAPKKQYEKL
jgi:hypothetical protein